MRVYVDAVDGRVGDAEDWVASFEELWRQGRASTDRFMRLMGPTIRLVAPGLSPTVGRAAGTEAFRRTFRLFPDLRAEVLRWSAREDCLFIEMQFSATAGGRPCRWWNVDRFLFQDGYAVERIAYFNPLVVRRALLRSPVGWCQLLRSYGLSAAQRDRN
ncbi:MAG: nuclear transport factor 2 family protein [Myxococcales bacterium]|nr:nuclear transport factor 2 family protein [Myxococcales bacterium]